MTPKNKLEATLRKAIERSEASRYAISQATGIPQSALSRFVSGERSISLDYADKLARYFGLELKPEVSP